MVLVSLKPNSAVTLYGYGRFLLQTIGLTKAGMAYRTVLVSLRLNSVVATYGYSRFLLQTIGLTKAGMAVPYGTGLTKAE